MLVGHMDEAGSYLGGSYKLKDGQHSTPVVVPRDPLSVLMRHMQPYDPYAPCTTRTST